MEEPLICLFLSGTSHVRYLVRQIKKPLTDITSLKGIPVLS
ncbi:MAG TPA: hypothetical protein VJ943_03750 [Desulfotignum sp.]|nr:hypothetical protein [Desulfotignum sp.]